MLETPADTKQDNRTVANKLSDEASLVWGAKDSVWSGVKAGFTDMYEHPLHAAEAFGIAAVAGVLASNPYGRAALYGLSALGVAAMVEPDVASVWQDHSALPAAQNDLGMRVGTTLAYMPVGAAGFWTGAEVASVNWSALASRVTTAAGAADTAPLDVTKQGAQDFFRDNSGSLVDAKKQLYNVQFDKITEPGGRVVPTLENPAGENAPANNWVATRLDSTGQPVVENGMTNQWPVTEKTILKTYQTSPEQLASTTNFTAPTKIDAPPVKMAPVYGQMNLETPWGTMSTPKPDASVVSRVLDAVNNRPLGWLANYDYSPATSQPGSSFALITGRSFGQTYELVPAVVSSNGIDFSGTAAGALYGGVFSNHGLDQAS